MSFATLDPAQQQALLEGPAVQPPAGILPDFTRTSNDNALGYGILITSVVLSAILVLVRLYVKILCDKKMQVEDYLVTTALAVHGGFVYFMILFLRTTGLYVHQWNVRLKDLSEPLYILWANDVIYGIIVMLLKAGILLEWIHIFAPRGLNRTFFWTCHVTIWVNVIFYVICTFVELFRCSPREKAWNPLLPGGSCLNNYAIILSTSVINLISDLITIALPQKAIWNLHLSWQKKFGISAVFATGVFCVCGALRMVYSIKFLNLEDVIYNISPIGLWCVGEITSGFFILCVPSLPKALKSAPFMQRFASMVKSWTGVSANKRSISDLQSPSLRKQRSKKSTQSSDEGDFDEYALVTPQSANASCQSNPA